MSEKEKEEQRILQPREQIHQAVAMDVVVEVEVEVEEVTMVIALRPMLLLKHIPNERITVVLKTY